MDLFEYMSMQRKKEESPLAVRMRPKNLDEVVGQQHIIGKDKLLYRAIKADKISSLIFYGPPGTGKTTLAKVIANTTSADFVQMNATTSGKKDMEQAVSQAKDAFGMYGKKTILFIDEIHRFNKAQQDYLLPFVEDGTVILIGATTENPYFEVNSALLSRSQIFHLEPLSQKDVYKLVKTAVEDNKRGMGAYGTEITEEAAQFLEGLVAARYNIFVSGGTNSGKTTFLNALSSFIPRTERVITIEDSAELQISQVPNLVRLETRDANTEGKGQITISQLIRASLRMNPDRIIVGEVRGAEALDMLQAMNTGHPGSLSTGHSNSARDMLNRLETMVLMGARLPLEAVRSQIASALDILVHLGRLGDGSRKVLSIVEVGGISMGEIETEELYRYDRETGRLEKTGELKNREKLGDTGNC